MNFQEVTIITFLSSYQVRYVATTATVCHGIWVRSLLNELHLPQGEAIKILVDYKSMLSIVNKLLFQNRSKKN